MAAYELRSARWLAAEVHAQVLRPGDTVVDATLGNGHDALRLAGLVGETGTLIGLDIQAEAVARSRERLAEAGFMERCELHVLSHERMAEVVREPVRLIVFNLGWLPGGDKRVTTHWATTKAAVEAALGLLQPHGVLTVCAYPGHAAGDEERNALPALFAQLRPQDFNVLHQRFLNAGDGAPECFVVQKQGGKEGPLLAR